MFNSPKWVNSSLSINERLTCLQFMGKVIAFYGDIHPVYAGNY